LLILDEPTNHLDMETIDWLEQKLIRFQGALVMVTHDRYFLDKICTRIFEIDQKKLYQIEGNYQAYLEARALRVDALQKSDQVLSAALRVELAWLRRGAKARSTKQKARKDRIDGMLATEKYKENQSMDLGVSGRRLGKKILNLEQVSFGYEGKTCITNFSYEFSKGEKIGILGPNGVGKSTLLNLISGRLTPQSGHIHLGDNTVLGYFDQHSESASPEMRVLDYVSGIGTVLTLHDGSVVTAEKLLERFLFGPHQHRTAIGQLSGGEKRRLDLVCTLLANPNFLLFDEPTNDLDITTLTLLEDFLLQFSGCALVISHDRYFLDRVIDQLFIFEGSGKIRRFWGTYADFIEEEKRAQTPPTKPVSKRSPSETPESQLRKKMTFKEKQEWGALESEIEILEAEKEKLSALFSDASANAQDYELAGKRLAEIETLLQHKWDRWAILAELSE
jgi:ATP-binding cassette subfamily F protein uup